MRERRQKIFTSRNVKYSVPDILDLVPEPINPEWVLAGSPEARSQLLARTSDGLSWTALWECTPGRFRWQYGLDETVLILDGAVDLTWPSGETTSLGPGDLAFFPANSEAEWHVRECIRKVAFLRVKRRRVRSALRRVPFLRSGVRAVKKALRGSTVTAGALIVFPLPGLADSLLALA